MSLLFTSLHADSWQPLKKVAFSRHGSYKDHILSKSLLLDGEMSLEVLVSFLVDEICVFSALDGAVAASAAVKVREKTVAESADCRASKLLILPGLRIMDVEDVVYAFDGYAESRKDDIAFGLRNLAFGLRNLAFVDELLDGRLGDRSPGFIERLTGGGNAFPNLLHSGNDRLALGVGHLRLVCHESCGDTYSLRSLLHRADRRNALAASKDCRGCDY